VDTLGTATISIAGATVTIGGSITTDLIECGGIAPGSFAAGSNLNNPFTVIDGTTATFIRQDGFMRGVIFNVFAADNDPAGFSYRIFRPNGATYDFVGKSEDFGVPVIEVGANHTQRFTTPVACRAEDRSGFFTDSNFNSISCKAGGTTRFVSADQQSSNAFAGTVAFTINHQVLAVSPIVCCTGDSIMAGTAAGSNFTPYLDGGPSGTLTSQIPFQLRTSIGYGFEFQNLASAGQTFAWVRSTGVPACIAAKASWIWIHCGVNDVATGRLWSAVEADLDAIKALCVNGERLIIDEILPWTAGTDPQAATLRTFNANLATWCSANSATLLVCHDAMGQLRVSTGFLDDLKTAYNQDGVHLKQAGVDAMAAIAQAAFGLT
jgi:lysophospholipase L1-like esterase